jgi:NAD-dependent deacetylase
MSDDVEMIPGELPKCTCGGIVRPDVVWYGEMLPEAVLRQAFRETETCELFLTIGTSGLVQPAASLPIVASRAGAYVAEINVEETVLSGQIHETILGKSGEILPEIVRQVWGRHP